MLRQQIDRSAYVRAFDCSGLGYRVLRASQSRNWIVCGHTVCEGIDSPGERGVKGAIGIGGLFKFTQALGLSASSPQSSDWQFVL